MSSTLPDAAWAMFYRDGKRLDEIAAELNVPIADVLAVKEPMDQMNAAFVQVIVQRIGSMQTVISEQEALLSEQDKAVVNLADALKRRNPDTRKTEKIKRLFDFKRNADYVQSVTLGVKHGIFEAPSILLSGLNPVMRNLIQAIGAALTVFMTTMLWIVAVPVMGLFGRISPRESK